MLKTEHVWTTTNGRKIPVNKLTDEHLINILNLMELSVVSFYGNSAPYPVLRGIANKRGLNWRKYQHIPLRDGDLLPKSSTNRANFQEEDSLAAIAEDIRKWGLRVQNLQASSVIAAESLREIRRKIFHEALNDRKVKEEVLDKDIKKILAKSPVRLGDLKPGTSFRIRRYRSCIYMKGCASDTIHLALKCAAYQTVGEYPHTKYFHDSGPLMCLVVNLTKGNIFLGSIHDEVYPVEDL